MVRGQVSRRGRRVSKKNKNKNKHHNQGQHSHPYHHTKPAAPVIQESKTSLIAPTTEQKRSAATRRSLEQERAADALRKIKELSSAKPGFYVSYVSALPATIVMNGLGQALVMLLAKAKGNKSSEHYLLHQHIASWLSERVEGLKAGSGDGVVEALMNGDQDLYVRAQTEAMSYLHWLKQFARAYLQEKEGQGD